MWKNYWKRDEEKLQERNVENLLFSLEKEMWKNFKKRDMEKLDFPIL